MRSVQDR